MCEDLVDNLSGMLRVVQVDSVDVLVKEMEVVLITLRGVVAQGCGQAMQGIGDLLPGFLNLSSPFQPTLITMSSGPYSIGGRLRA